MVVVYHFAVVLMSLLIFFMKITGKNSLLTLFLQFAGKVIPLFSMGYAVAQILKYFN